MNRALVLLVVMVVGCSTGLLSSDPPSETHRVLLINADETLAIHIFRSDESFAPSNRIEPEGSRSVEMLLVHGTQITFRAGRDGEILASVGCEPFFGEEALLPAVAWGGGGLSCSGWDGG